MNIREANKNDARSIANVQVKSWRFAYREIMPKEYLDSLSVKEKTETWLKSLSEKSPGINLVIENNKKIIGFCVFGPARDEDLQNYNVGELVALNILPSHWGNGYGTKMINYVINQSKLKEWQALYLWVLKQNKRAIAVYEFNGFMFEGTEKHDKKLTGHELHEIRYVVKFSRGNINKTNQHKNAKKGGDGN